MKFYTSKGWLTMYAYACGYAETNVDWNTSSKRVSLWRDSACWQVQASDDGHRTYWESFDSYKEAQKAFKAELKKRGLKRKVHHA